MGQKISHAEKVRQDFLWLGSEWFRRASYVKHGTRPVVLCFNNAEDHRIFKSLSAWKNVFASAGQDPLFIDLRGSLEDSEGAFHWFLSVLHEEPDRVLSGSAMSSEIHSEVGRFFESQMLKPYIALPALLALLASGIRRRN